MNWEEVFEKKITEISNESADPAHDLLHFKRVVATAKKLAAQENANGGNANLEIVVPAAWLHDFVIIAKNDPRRSIASKLSAEGAIKFLRSIDYPEKHSGAIAHAIAAHSFTAKITAETLEAKIVQDSDRLDGLGAIGIARVFATAGILKRPFYSLTDPFCETREPNDSSFTVDHFYKKLFKTAESLQTSSGKREGVKRVQSMKNYLEDLAQEI